VRARVARLLHAFLREFAPTTARTDSHGAVAAIAGTAHFFRAHTVIEERHGFAGALRTLGGVVEERHGFAGALRTLGVWGPFRGPH